MDVRHRGRPGGGSGHCPHRPPQDAPALEHAAYGLSRSKYEWPEIGPCFITWPNDFQKNGAVWHHQLCHLAVVYDCGFEMVDCESSESDCFFSTTLEELLDLRHYLSGTEQSKNRTLRDAWIEADVTEASGYVWAYYAVALAVINTTVILAGAFPWEAPYSIVVFLVFATALSFTILGYKNVVHAPHYIKIGQVELRKDAEGILYGLGERSLVSKQLLSALSTTLRFELTEQESLLAQTKTIIHSIFAGMTTSAGFSIVSAYLENTDGEVMLENPVAFWVEMFLLILSAVMVSVSVWILIVAFIDSVRKTTRIQPLSRLNQVFSFIMMNIDTKEIQQTIEGANKKSKKGRRESLAPYSGKRRFYDGWPRSVYSLFLVACLLIAIGLVCRAGVFRMSFLSMFLFPAVVYIVENGTYKFHRHTRFLKSGLDKLIGQQTRRIRISTLFMYGECFALFILIGISSSTISPVLSYSFLDVNWAGLVIGAVIIFSIVRVVSKADAKRR